MRGLSCRWPVSARRSSISTTTDGRICSSAADTWSRCPLPATDRRATQHRVPQPRRQREVGGADRRSGIQRVSACAPSRLRLRRPGRRRPDRRGGHRDWARHAEIWMNRSRGVRPLAGYRSARNQEQPRRHRRAHQASDQERHTVQPHDHQRWLRLIQLRPGAFRTGNRRSTRSRLRFTGLPGSSKRSKT